jgi:hypothetical protein
MKKIALFVEGQTELVFAKELVRHLALARRLCISTAKFEGGKNHARHLVEFKMGKHRSVAQAYVMIYDCGGDERVKTDIIEQLPGLSRAGYACVIGIRDVYPNGAHLEQIRRFLYAGIPKTPTEVRICLAVQEVEAWFLAEEHHYARMRPGFRLWQASEIAGIDLAHESTEGIPHPAQTLREIYTTMGFGYRKSKMQVERLVEHLDYQNLICNVRRRVPSFGSLVEELEKFLCFE